MAASALDTTSHTPDADVTPTGSSAADPSAVSQQPALFEGPFVPDLFGPVAAMEASSAPANSDLRSEEREGRRSQQRSARSAKPVSRHLRRARRLAGDLRKPQQSVRDRKRIARTLCDELLALLDEAQAANDS